MGTVPYMSPEQVQGRPLDVRSDIFSLGIILYEMVTGQRPFHGESSAEIVSSILRDTPPSVVELRADLPSELGRVIGRCLEKSVAERFPSAQELRYGLRGVPTGATPVRAATTPASRPPAPVDSGAERAGTGVVGRRAAVQVRRRRRRPGGPGRRALRGDRDRPFAVSVSVGRRERLGGSPEGRGRRRARPGRQARRALRAGRKHPQGRLRHSRERPARRRRDGSAALGRDVQPGPPDVEHLRGAGRRRRPHRRHRRRQLRGARAFDAGGDPAEGRRRSHARRVAVPVLRLPRADHALGLRGAQEPAGARGGAGRPPVGPVGLPRADLRRRIRVRLRDRRDRLSIGPWPRPAARSSWIGRTSSRSSRWRRRTSSARTSRRSVPRPSARWP